MGIKKQKHGIILALDGGGLRSIFQIEILQKMQELFGSPNVWSQKIDLIAGSSFSGVLALSLAGRCEKANDLEEMYALFRKKTPSLIAPINLLNRLGSWIGLHDSVAQTQKRVQSFLKEVFNVDDTLSSLPQEVFLPLFDLNAKKAFYVQRQEALEDKYNYTLKDLAYTSMSFPGITPVKEIYTVNATEAFLGMDGMCIFGNVSLSAFTHARQKYPEIESWSVINIGVGTEPLGLSYKAVGKKGLLAWLPKLLPTTMRGDYSITEECMKQMVEIPSFRCENYIRINCPIQTPVKFYDAKSIKKFSKEVKTLFTTHPEKNTLLKQIQEAVDLLQRV